MQGLEIQRRAQEALYTIHMEGCLRALRASRRRDNFHPTAESHQTRYSPAYSRSCAHPSSRCASSQSRSAVPLPRDRDFLHAMPHPCRFPPRRSAPPDAPRTGSAHGRGCLHPRADVRGSPDCQPPYRQEVKIMPLSLRVNRFQADLHAAAATLLLRFHARAYTAQKDYTSPFLKRFTA